MEVFDRQEPPSLICENPRNLWIKNVVVRWFLERQGNRYGRLDICGNLPQIPDMSQSIRLNDHLIEAAKRDATLFHRSPPQQIEHWAAIGRVMEAALSYPALEKVVRAVGRKDLDQALTAVGTPDGVAKAQDVIRRTSNRKSTHQK